MFVESLLNPNVLQTLLTMLSTESHALDTIKKAELARN